LVKLRNEEINNINNKKKNNIAFSVILLLTAMIAINKLRKRHGR